MISTKNISGRWEVSPFSLFLWSVILFNVGLFILANSIPMVWEHGEVMIRQFYWSTQAGEGPNLLRSGLHLNDLTRIFSSYYELGVYRTRQFSHLAEMLFFKFWQYFQILSFRDYTLILIHLTNTVLVFFVVRALTQNFLTGTFSALLVLNSGVALSTLLFPFRSSKLLVLTLFLLAWTRILSSPGKFLESSPRNLILFFLLFFLALFTDETAVLIFPILFVYLLMSEKITRPKLFRLIRYTCLTVGLYVLLGISLLWLGTKIDHRPLEFLLQSHLHNLPQYFKHMSFLHDIFIALFAYFLRRNYGYWEFSIWGGSSLICFIGILLMLSHKKHEKIILKTASTILIFLLIKALILPHNSGVQEILMPPGTIFPSLLFFNYYYTYCEAILVAIALGLLLKPLTYRYGESILLLFFITIIAASNVFHAKEGIVETMIFHERDENHQRKLSNILAIKKLLAKEFRKPVYLSFPSGGKPFFGYDYNQTFFDNWPEAYEQNLSMDFISYAMITPVHYLPAFEKGDLIMSLKNAPSARPFFPDQELAKAKLFYDVPSQQMIDLEKIRQLYGEKALIPQAPEASWEGNTVVPEDLRQHLIFFIKGAGRLTLESAKVPIEIRQNYGYSYQLLAIPIANLNLPPGSEIKFVVSPEIGESNLKVIGPFLIKLEENPSLRKH